MKIAFVFDSVYPYCIGGVEKRIWELGCRLCKKGHEVHVYCVKYWEGENVIQNEHGLWLHGVCKPRRLFTKSRRSIFQAIIYGLNVFIPLLKNNFDIIDCQRAPYFHLLPTKFSSYITKSNMVVTWHEFWGDYWYEYMGKWGLFGVIAENSTIWLSKRIITVSNFTKQQLEKKGVKKETKLIPNGINLKLINDVEPCNGNIDILYAGRLIKDKGVHLLIDAINIVKQDINCITCTIIGEGPERESIKRKISKLKLTNNIQLIDFIKDYSKLISYMKSSTVFVLPSSREGFGIVVIEANAAGIPVVTIEKPKNAAKELITSGINGYVSYPTPQDLANKIIMALNNKRVMSKSSKEFAEAYDWNKVVIKYEEYCKHVCNKESI